MGVCVSQWANWLIRQYGELEIWVRIPAKAQNFSLKIIIYMSIWYKKFSILMNNLNIGDSFVKKVDIEFLCFCNNCSYIQRYDSLRINSTLNLFLRGRVDMFVKRRVTSEISRVSENLGNISFHSCASSPPGCIISGRKPFRPSW